MTKAHGLLLKNAADLSAKMMELFRSGVFGTLDAVVHLCASNRQFRVWFDELVEIEEARQRTYGWCYCNANTCTEIAQDVRGDYHRYCQGCGGVARERVEVSRRTSNRGG